RYAFLWLIQEAADSCQSLRRRRVLLVLRQGLSIFVPGAQPVPFGFVHPAEIHVGITVAFVSWGLKRALEPRNGFLDFALHHQIGADVVVWISERRIDLDGLMAFLDRIIDAPHPTVGPSQECVGFGS